MVSIDGFQYEPYEHSSSIARKDFRHSHSDYENARGHRSKRKAPKKKKYACESTLGQHVYVTVKYVKPSNDSDYMCFWIHGDCVHVYCLACGFLKRHCKAKDFSGDIDQVMDAEKLSYTGFPLRLPRIVR